MRASRLMVAAAMMLAVLAKTTPAAPYVITPDSIYRDIGVLASDSLEGREVGEVGEWKAAQFIESKFKAAGLLPKGDDGKYFQSFDFIKKISLGPNNSLAINGKELILDQEFQPLAQSSTGKFNFSEIVPVGYGIRSDDSSYDDYKGLDVAGKAVIIMRFSPKPDSNSHVDYSKYESITEKIQLAISRHAAGIFFVTPSGQEDSIPPSGLTHVTPKNIPIIFLRQPGLKKLDLDFDNPAPATAVGETEIIPVHDTGYNVVGYLPGKSDTTIIIGGHFDHLGYGGPASKYMGTDRVIHHGADDNGSGSAGVIELSAYFASRRSELHHSMLFIAFSGEEAGLLGSSWYVRHWTIDSSKVRLMLNLDMIGRLRNEDHGLTIFGTGTATEFKNYFDSLKSDSVKMTFSEPGTGPSDHTAFYNCQIPVLFFCTNAHEDYHKPSDVLAKIDTKAETKVLNLVADIARHFDQAQHPLTFQKTVDPTGGARRSSYSVTMGIMPDYAGQVKGLRVDGVTPGRPAEKAGIQKGDVVIKMGTLVIDDMAGYMNALGKFHKGDSITVMIERGKDTLSLPVVFK
ncbi:MAG: M28 family peptidase [Candidatus Zixiibacteriota bacterium]